jgi:hypothetical protein
VLEHRQFSVRSLRKWFGLLAIGRDLIRGHELELAKLRTEKCSQNPKYPGMLQLYHACRVSNDMGFLRTVLQAVTPATSLSS